MLDLNLLRSVPYPGYNPALSQVVEPGEAHPGYTDQAEHDFCYAQDLVTSGVIQVGYALNQPLRVLKTGAHAGSRPATTSLLSISAPNIILETIKQAEDDDSLILCLYEASHATTTSIHFGFPVKQVVETDLMERSIQLIQSEFGSIRLTFQPFEIKTIKVTRQ